MYNPVSLKTIDIKGLFGSFNYHIEFPNGKDYLILTSPNGYGKTTILNIISAIQRADLFYFLTIPFEQISLSYSSDVDIIIKSSYAAVNKNLPNDELSVNNESLADDAIGQDHENEITKSGELSFSIHTLIGEASFELNNSIIRKAIRRIGFYRRLVLQDFDIHSKSYLDFLKEHQQALLTTIAKDTGGISFLVYLEMLQNVKAIESQRLFVKSEDKNWKFRIEDVSSELKRLLEDNQKKYLITSQQKDALFINNVLNAKQSITEDKYNELKEHLQKKINNLKEHALITDIEIPDFSANHAAMLGCYILDLEDKLGVFNDILQKINLFMALVKGKHFTRKRIEVSLDGGLRVRSVSDDSFIDLRNLSSGEQNELILLYDLIFGLGNDCMLLIDEPEISLHVSWQLRFMNELKSIARLKNLKVIVATHSPQIINDDWNNCFDLYAASRK